MPVDIDWTVLEKVGIAGVAIVALILGYKLFSLFLQQWKDSTDAINKNTAGFEKLSQVFETQNQIQLDFQKESIKLAKETNDKVNEIHKKIV